MDGWIGREESCCKYSDKPNNPDMGNESSKDSTEEILILKGCCREGQGLIEGGVRN